MQYVGDVVEPVAAVVLRQDGVGIDRDVQQVRNGVGVFLAVQSVQRYATGAWMISALSLDAVASPPALQAPSRKRPVMERTAHGRRFIICPAQCKARTVVKCRFALRLRWQFALGDPRAGWLELDLTAWEAVYRRTDYDIAGAAAAIVFPAPMPRAARAIAADKRGDRAGPIPRTAGAIPRRSSRRRSRRRPRASRLCTVPTGQHSSPAACS